MGSSIFDDQTLDIPCPGCNYVKQLTVVWIKAHEEYTCDGCGKTVGLDKAGLLEGLKEADDAIGDLKRTIQNFNKRK
jgi:ribosomal protein S27E